MRNFREFFRVTKAQYFRKSIVMACGYKLDRRVEQKVHDLRISSCNLIGRASALLEIRVQAVAEVLMIKLPPQLVEILKHKGFDRRSGAYFICTVILVTAAAFSSSPLFSLLVYAGLALCVLAFIIWNEKLASNARRDERFDVPAGTVESPKNETQS